MKILSKIAIVLLVAILLVCTGIFLRVLILPGHPDFTSYYYGTASALQNIDPYVGSAEMFGQFLYPPPALLLFLPFQLVPFILAEKVWVVLSLCCYFASLLLLGRLTKTPLRSIDALLLCIGAVLFFPAKFTLGMGQINMVILLILVLFLYYSTLQKYRGAGILLAVSLSLKLFPLLWLVYLLIKKKWEVLITCVLSGGVLLLMVSSLFGLDLVISFVQTMFIQIGRVVDSYYNQSLTAFWARAFPDTYGFEVARVSILITLLILGMRSIFFSISSQATQVFASLITLSLIVQPITWQHHLVWSLIPLIVIYRALRELRHRKLLAMLAVSYLLIAMNIKDPAAVPMLITSHGLYGLVVLYGIQMYLLVKQNKKIIFAKVSSTTL